MLSAVFELLSELTMHVFGLSSGGPGVLRDIATGRIELTVPHHISEDVEFHLCSVGSIRGERVAQGVASNEMPVVPVTVRVEFLVQVSVVRSVLDLA